VISIDELDRKIIHCLAVDGRAPFSRVAEILDVSDQTVARRYRRLRSAGALRVVGLADSKRFGAQGWFLRVQCVPGAGTAIAEALARRPDTAWVQLLSGDTEILCSLRAYTTEGRDSVLARLPRTGRITAVTTHSLLHKYAGGTDGLRFLQVLPADRVEPLRRPVRAAAGEVEPAGPAELDAALFAVLGEDGRAGHAEIAEAVGWSESTVRRRMDQLREAGALYYDLEVDLAGLGFHITAWMWMSVRPSALAAAGEALGKFPEVAYAAATTGPTNLAAAVVCRDSDELYAFLTERAGALTAVERVETAPVIRTLKQAVTIR
jgi:DNA-binding Lrp family transcriptional regulator